MSKPIIQIGNEQREMTNAEFEQWQNDVASIGEKSQLPPEPDVE